jgi:propionyl-CoA carboxylase alpha chain
MRVALDGFEVEGIGHNLPFLSAVMDHPRFVSGDITTAFIAEEYPEGFDGVTLPTRTSCSRVAAAAAAMHRVAEIRRTRVRGGWTTTSGGGQRLGREPAGQTTRCISMPIDEGSTVTFR